MSDYLKDRKKITKRVHSIPYVAGYIESHVLSADSLIKQFTVAIMEQVEDIKRSGDYKNPVFSFQLQFESAEWEHWETEAEFDKRMKSAAKQKAADEKKLRELIAKYPEMVKLIGGTK